MKVTTVAVVLLAGCATAPPNGTQVRVANAVDTCNEETGTNVRLDYVSPEGRFNIRTQGELTPQFQRFQQCLRDKYGYKLGGY